MIYAITVTIGSLFTFCRKIDKSILAIILLCLIAPLLSRGLVGTDINAYRNIWEKLYSLENALSTYNQEFVFFSVLWLLKSISRNTEWMIQGLTLVSLFILFSGFYQIAHHHSKKNRELLIVFFFIFIFCSSSFYLLNSNILRQGLAQSLFVAYIGAYLQRRYLITFILALISLFTHHSSIIGIFAIILTHCFRTHRSLLFIYLSTCLLAFSGIKEYSQVLPWLQYKLELYSAPRGNHLNEIKLCINIAIFIILNWIGRNQDRSIRLIHAYCLMITLCLFPYPEIFKRLMYYISYIEVIRVALYSFDNCHRVFGKAPIVLAVIYLLAILHHPSLQRNLEIKSFLW